MIYQNNIDKYKVANSIHNKDHFSSQTTPKVIKMVLSNSFNMWLP